MSNNVTICCCAVVKSEVTIEKKNRKVVKEEPMPNIGDPVCSKICANQSMYLLGVAMEDPLADPLPIVSPNVAHLTTDQLLHTVAETIQVYLRPNWICLTEGDGIHVMQLSRSFEKCVQRRLFFQSSEAVHLSVHCVPLPILNFVPCLSTVKLKRMQDISEFVDAMETILNVVIQLEICTGVSHEKYKPLWMSMTTAEIDKNPYQEARYSITLRSNNCRRLIRPRQRTCCSCNRLHDCLRMKTKKQKVQ